jgi:hypothetical protein
MIEPKATRPHWPDAVQDPSKDLSGLKPWPGPSNASKSHTIIGSPRLAPMAALISCLFGESGGRTPSGSAPARAPAKPRTSPRTLTLSSARKKPMRPSSSKELSRRSKIAPFGSNWSKSTTANMAAMLAHFSNLPVAASSASNRELRSVKTSTRRISWTQSLAGTSSPSPFLARTSGFRRGVPHLLLNLPLAVRLTMQH